MFELIFVIPILFFIYLFTRKRDKSRPWLAIFNSQNDFLNNILSVFATICAGQIIWQLFDILFLKNYTGTPNRSIVELVSFCIILVTVAIGYFGKAFHTFSYSILSLLFFYFYLLGSWSYPENGIMTRPIFAIIAGVFVTFSLYLATKIIENNDQILRVTTYLQFCLIGVIYAGLAVLSSYYFPKQSLLDGVNLDLQHLPLVGALIVSVVVFIATSLYSLGKQMIKPFEFTGVLFAGFLPIILNFSGISGSNTNFYQPNVTAQSVLFNSIASLLFLLWPIFIIRHGSTEGVKWKHNYGLILLVFGVIGKITELFSAGLLQSGFVFVLIGATLIVSAIFLQLRKTKSNNPAL